MQMSKFCWNIINSKDDSIANKNVYMMLNYQQDSFFLPIIQFSTVYHKTQYNTQPDLPNSITK